MIIIEDQLYIIDWMIDGVFCLWNGHAYSIFNPAGEYCTAFFQFFCPD